MGYLVATALTITPIVGVVGLSNLFIATLGVNIIYCIMILLLMNQYSLRLLALLFLVYFYHYFLEELVVLYFYLNHHDICWPTSAITQFVSLIP